MKEKENAIVPVEKYAILAADPKQVVEVIQENLGGQQLRATDLDQVKVPSGGGTTWTLPGLEGEVETKSIQGVIVFHKMPRAYWPSDYDGSKNPPDCYSDDSFTGIGTPGGDCTVCPYAAFGSSSKEGSKAQACKQMRQIFVLPEGSLLPIVVTAPPTSLINFKQYFMRLAGQGVVYYGAITELKLRKVKGDGVPDYSVIDPFIVGKLGPEQVQVVKAYAESMKRVFDAVKIEGGY
jgi:hypothetical protein